MAKKKAAVKSAKQPVYSLALTMGDKVYKATGDTILQALDKVTPPKVTTKGVFVFTKGKVRKELVYGVPQLKKIFAASATTRAVFAKRFQFLLG